MNPLHGPAICAIGTLAVLAEVAPVPTADAIGRLTLDGALVIAVGVLWRALAAKDKQVVEMATKVTETMALVMEAVKELRATVSGLKLAYEELPCALRDNPMNGARK